jgi:hypothetical protein
MNKGTQRATGEWLLFLGSDDELHDQDALAKSIGSQHTTDCDVLYGNALVIGKVSWAADGTIYDGPFDLKKLLDRNICHQAIFYKAELLKQVGGYQQKYVVVADWDLNMRCWARGRFKYVDAIVANFHGGGNSSNHRPDPEFARDVTRNVIRYFNLSPNDPLINTSDFCGKRADDARRAEPITPKRIFRALARRLGIIG